MVQRISILGCGWLGHPLGIKLASQGHFVRGSTTTPDNIPLLEQDGIEPYYLKLAPNVTGDDLSNFVNTDQVILAFPPPKVDNRIHYMIAQADEIIASMNRSSASRLIMISSTGVYASKFQHADESDPYPPQSKNGEALKSVEERLIEKLQATVTIVRMAGLFGPGRHPGRFLSGRTVQGNGEEPVNMIHLEDAIGIIDSLIHQPDISGIFNACCLQHPKRRDFFNRACSLKELQTPIFSDKDPRPWKVVISNKIRQATGYQFVYDQPLDALDAC